MLRTAFINCVFASHTRATQGRSNWLGGHPAITFKRSLRPIALCPCDKDLGNGLPELYTGHVVHRIVNAAPDSRIAGFLTYGANEIGMRGEQVRQHLRF